MRFLFCFFVFFFWLLFLFFFSFALKTRRETKDPRVTQPKMVQTVLMGSKEMPALKVIKETLGFQSHRAPKAYQELKGLKELATSVSVYKKEKMVYLLRLIQKQCQLLW